MLFNIMLNPFWRVCVHQLWVWAYRDGKWEKSHSDLCPGQNGANGQALEEDPGEREDSSF